MRTPRTTRSFCTRRRFFTLLGCDGREKFGGRQVERKGMSEEDDRAEGACRAIATFRCHSPSYVLTIEPPVAMPRCQLFTYASTSIIHAATSTDETLPYRPAVSCCTEPVSHPSVTRQSHNRCQNHKGPSMVPEIHDWGGIAVWVNAGGRREAAMYSTHLLSKRRGKRETRPETKLVMGQKRGKEAKDKKKPQGRGGGDAGRGVLRMFRQEQRERESERESERDRERAHCPEQVVHVDRVDLVVEKLGRRHHSWLVCAAALPIPAATALTPVHVAWDPRRCRRYCRLRPRYLPDCRWGQCRRGRRGPRSLPGAWW